MEIVIVKYRSYQEYKAELDSELSKTAEGFVRIGYLLRLAEDTDILKESGYSSVLEFAQAEYNIDKTQVSRFININKKFSEGGYSDRLQEKYRGFGYSKLTLMMQLPDTVNEELTPDYSKSEIQQIKNQIDEENKTTDLEIMMEGQDPVMEEAEDDLCRAVRQLAGDIQDGEEIPRLYKEIWTAGRTGLTAEDLQVIMTPAGQRMYTMRIQGMGGRNLSLKDHDNGDSVALINMRTGEKQEYTWNRLLEVWRHLVSGGATYQEAWQQLYGKPWPEERKIAPVQPKKRKESKVVKAKKPERKSIKTERSETKPAEPQTKQPDPPTKSEELPTKNEEKQTETPDTTAVPAETKEKEAEKAEETPETKTEFQQEITDETQIPGQTELIKDFPEYCPPDMNTPEQQDQSEVKPAYATRRIYIASVDADTAAEYMGKAMEKAIRNMPGVSFGVLTKESFWKEFFETEVDRNGAEIECVN